MKLLGLGCYKIACFDDRLQLNFLHIQNILNETNIAAYIYVGPNPIII